MPVAAKTFFAASEVSCRASASKAPDAARALARQLTSDAAKKIFAATGIN